MPLTVATLFSARGDTSNAATYVAPNFTPDKGCLLLGWVANSKASAPDTPAISDTRFTWTRIASKNAGSLHILHVFRAMAGTDGTTPAQGGATIGFPASQTGCVWGFLQISGVPNSSDGSNAIVQYASNTFGSSVTTSTTTISALQKNTNGIFAGLAIGVNSNPTVEGIYTAAATHPGYNTPASKLGMSWNLNNGGTEVTPSYSWSGGYTPGEIALEVVSYGTFRNVAVPIGTSFAKGPSDSFSSDSNPLASPWANVGYTAGQLRALSGQCIKTSPTTEADYAMHWTGAGSKSEQYSKFSYISGSDIGLIARSTATQCYQMNIVGGSIFAFHYWTSAGGWSLNVTSNITIPALTSGANVMFKVTGTTTAATFSAYVNGSNVGSRVYASTPLIGGYPGIQMYSGDSPTVENWAGGPIPQPVGLGIWALLVEASGAVVRTISKLSSIADNAIRSQWLKRPVTLIRPQVHSYQRLRSIIKTLPVSRTLTNLTNRAIVFLRSLPISRVLTNSVRYSRGLIRRSSLYVQRINSISYSRWLRYIVSTIRPVSFSVRRLVNYKKIASVSRSLLFNISRTAVFGRTARVTRSLLNTVIYSRWLIRRASVISTRLFSISRLRWLKWSISIIRTQTSVIRRLVNYRKTISIARSLLERVGRVAVFSRTISVVRSLRSIIEREWALFVRRASIQRAPTFAVKRIGQFIRRVSLVSSLLISVGRSVSGQLTLRTVTTIRSLSLSVRRLATYKKTISAIRSASFSVGRWVVRIRTLATTRSLLNTVRRLTERIRTSVVILLRTFSVKRLAWYKRPIALDRPLTILVKRIGQIGRRVATTVRVTYGLIWHLAGALTTRTVATVGRISEVVIRSAWKIRRVSVTRQASLRVSYSRWIKRLAERLGVGVSSAARSASYIRQVIVVVRNNFVIVTIITAVLRIWNAISSSYSNISVNSSSSKKTEVSSNSRQKERIS